MRHLQLRFLFVFLSSLSLAQAQEVLTNQSILAMNQAKASRSLIVDKINSSSCRFDMSTLGLMGLKSADLPESIMEAMLAVTRPTDLMHNEEVIRLYQAGLSRGLIIKKIQAGPTQFNVTTDGVIQMKTAKIPEQIIKVMMTGGAGSSPATAKPGNKAQSSLIRNDNASLAKSTEKPSTPAARSTVSAPDCDTWNDKFTKKTVRASRVTLRGMKVGATLMNGLVGRGSANAFGIEDMEVHLIFRRDGNELTLVLYASKPGIHTMFVSHDKPLMFLLEDESVLEFMPAENSESDFSGSGYSMESEMLMYYQLTSAQARILSQKLIKEYRLNFYNRKSAQDKVNDGRAQQVRLSAQCVLN